MNVALHARARAGLAGRAAAIARHLAARSSALRLGGMLFAALAAHVHPSPAPAATPGKLDALGLGRYTLQRVGTPSGERTARIPVEIDGRRVTLRLERASIRSPDFRVLVQDATGSLREVPAPASETWRGVVEGMAGSVVAASTHKGGLAATVGMPDGRVFCVQPVTALDSTAAPDLSVVYLADGTMPDGACTVHEAPQVVPPVTGTSAVAAAPRIADLAVDADNEYYVKNGSSVTATTNDIEALVNSVNVVYERDCEIRHRLAMLIVRSNPNDPYTSTDAEILYDEFSAHWNASQTGVARDMAHLMTGKNLDGGTIGYAAVGAVCNRSRAYGISEARYTTHLGRRTSLVAHELGHNWNADHCDGTSPCHIMCSSLGGCDGIGLPNFEPMGTADIRAFAASRTCLATGPVAVGAAPGGDRVELAAPSPSPFTRETGLRFYMPQAGAVRLAVYDPSGRRVATLIDGVAPAGWQVRTWRGVDDGGEALAPGVYHARLEAAGSSRMQKVILVR